jgi:DNA-binding CsgD family transcriptional regulator
MATNGASGLAYAGDDESKRAPRPEESVLDGMMAVCDALPVGVLLVDRRARVLLKNRLAARSLRLGAGILEADGRLRCELAEDTLAFAGALARAGKEQPAHPRVLTARRSDGRRAVELLVKPNPGDIVTVFVFDPERPVAFNARLAQELYGLSDREVDVARALVSGRTLAETAAYLHVERETVRSHLKQLFSKTQTTRQADVVRLFSSGLFGMGVEP